ncbi:YHS domain-containing (seleno)protein [Fibrella aquatilis]|uniref:YHS domain-containing protein n=1 Tax=Fibrella aquatilis TaxID=2817059 RepID=A0A939G5M3_9BACT|nr:YHS domain-containing (seleno)protein [Fibrella aquatilis]MBO0932326.1 hypothetical protein [Fibrella aquatilis]
MKIKLIALLAMCSLLTGTAMAQVPQRSADKKYLLNLDKNGCALQGYDCVAMFTQPDSTLKGKPDFSSMFEGATYWFSSAANKTLFDASPANYAPLYGGFCAIAVAEGNLRPIQVWTHQIIDGHLTVNHNAKALKLWLKKPEKNLQTAQKMWPTVSQKEAKYDILKSGETQESLAATSFEGPKK